MDYERIVLHVGTGRTGTSTIQAFLEKNRKCLLDRGFSYVGPDSLLSYPQDDSFLDKGCLARGLQEIGRRRENDQADNLIWSRESLSPYSFVRDLERLRMIEQGLPAAHRRVVIYLRRQDEFYRSAYLQWTIKHKTCFGPTPRFDQWFSWPPDLSSDGLRDADLDYHALVEPWAEVFGAENVVVRVLEKNQLVDGDLLRDFCLASELPAVDCDFDIPKANVSYNMELHDMLGMYNSVFEEPTYSADMVAFLDAVAKDTFFSRSFFSRGTLSPNRRIEILQRCEESNRKVARVFLGREDGVLFREPWPSPDDPHEPYRGLSLEKLVPILLHIIQKQDQRIGWLEQQMRKAGVKHALDQVRSVFSRVYRRVTSCDLIES